MDLTSGKQTEITMMNTMVMLKKESFKEPFETANRLFHQKETQINILDLKYIFLRWNKYIYKTESQSIL